MAKSQKRSKTSFRVLAMMEGYVPLFQQGYSPTEIAKIFNVSHSTVYDRLDEIAEKNGTKRKKLLLSVHETYNEQPGSKRRGRKPGSKNTREKVEYPKKGEFQDNEIYTEDAEDAEVVALMSIDLIKERTVRLREQIAGILNKEISGYGEE